MASIAVANYPILPQHLASDLDEHDCILYPEPNMFSQQPFVMNGMADFNVNGHDQFPASTGFDSTSMFAEAPHFSLNGRHSPIMYDLESPELRAPSNYSTASGPSTTSSVMGSPHSMYGNVPAPEWTSNNPLGITPGIVSMDGFSNPDFGFSAAGVDEFSLDYSAVNQTKSFVGESQRISRSKFHQRDSVSSNTGSLSSTSTFTASPRAMGHSYPIYQSPFFSQSSGNFVPPLQASYPTILNTSYAVRPVTTQPTDISGYAQTVFDTSPVPSHLSPTSPAPIKSGSESPYLNAQYSQYQYPGGRQPSVVSHQSFGSQDGNFSSEESREKGRCTYPDCGRVFKDLKAHMLTHQNERPEKCPIQTCDYHIKGFARKYDKNRHTLTHYKGTMVCGFCPGSGSTAEKSFNRADVFKRHLTSVHAVEQTPPNSRKKTSSTVSSGKKLSGYAPDATGKCSTCSATFQNAQDFYEHLDDCVIRIVQQEEPSEAINAQLLAEVESDKDVHETLRNNSLPITTIKTYSADDDEEDDDAMDDEFILGNKLNRRGKKTSPPNGVQKSRGLTHSKGGVTLHTKGRKKRKDYPSSWGCPTPQMKLKKRVLCIFDGQRRLWKDDMMLDTDHEVRLKLMGDEKAYVTDLDVQTMRRAEAFHGATEEEKGPWIADDLTGMDLEKLMEVKHE
ncbi:hypothetical protein F5884DRAFT_871954 [Xylogone sp. PMI_703]|nr:hypothetical protein F5884DRAFT_871954 [Xylogone sp. PMI_703]